MTHPYDSAPATPSEAEVDSPRDLGEEDQPGAHALRNEPSPAAEPSIADLAEMVRKYQDLYVRERAELENFKKRMMRDKLDSLRFATEPLARDLLPVVDNLERALGHAEGTDSPVAEGIKLVLKSLHEALDRHGVKRIDATGKPFDPNQHEAIAQVESAEHPASHVVAQHQSGFTLHERLLRPALVSVSGRKSPAAVETTPERD